MKIAITGGTGFVGRHLSQYLTALGHEPVLLARGRDRRHAPAGPLILSDLSDPTSLADAIRGCDALPIAPASIARLARKPINASMSTGLGISLRQPRPRPFRAFFC